MIILLDENFPLRFYTRLQREGFSAEHILLTHRGIHDREIFTRLKQEELLFLTQDEDFGDAAPDCKASIIWSRVTQSMAIDQRVELRLGAVQQFFSKKWTEKFFELYDDGKLHPVDVVSKVGFPSASPRAAPPANASATALTMTWSDGANL